jgi:formylglycine-generating enzyme required for sulfatase activity
VPGYTLVQFLGRGGFGTVWRAAGPGGFAVALKFITLGDKAGAVELRSMELMKDVRHANLLGQFGAWERDGVLIIAMELADRTLMDRLREAVAQGLAGVPRPELLEYLHDAAKGLDHLNSLGVQHRDVKPQNLLLVGGSVKVADFGLAKLLEHTSASNTGAMTPAYAAPEFFGGAVSAHSDQYSLAMTYCQLRGNRLPFSGSHAQMLDGHLLRPPDLTMLPEEERPAVARALAKEPDDRWPSCRAFLDALAMDAAGTPAPAPAPETTRTWRPRRRRRAWPAALVACALLALGGVTPFFLLRFGVWQPTRGDAGAPDHSGDAPPPDKGNAGPPPEKKKGQEDAAAPPAEKDKDKDKGEAAPPPARPAIRLPAIRRVVVETGETKAVTVRVERDHCPGPIRLDVDGLPDGVQTTTAVIAPDDDSADLALTVTLAAALGAGRGTVTAISGDARAVATLDFSVEPGKECVNSVHMKLVRISAGKFTIGTAKEAEFRGKDEGPQHEVEITQAFHMAASPVTRGQFAAFVKDTNYKTEAETDGRGGLGYNALTHRFEGMDLRYTWRDPGWSQTDDHPVVNVTWNDAQKFCEWLSKKEGRTYELPTEAEWEYACRAGTTTRYWCGDKDDSLKGAANVADPSLKAKLDPDVARTWNFHSWDDGFAFTSPVGSFKANPWGLYDMHGNVWQWCADRYGLYRDGAVKDPKGAETGERRVMRGGAWDSGPKVCRSATRRCDFPGTRANFLGFRVVLRPS